MQKDLLEKVRAFRDANTFRVETYSEFKTQLDESGGFFMASWVPEQRITGFWRIWTVSARGFC